MIEVKTTEDMRGVVTLLTNSVIDMCNAKTTDEVINTFITSKDLLVALYQYNTKRTGDNK